MLSLHLILPSSSPRCHRILVQSYASKSVNLSHQRDCFAILAETQSVKYNSVTEGRFFCHAFHLFASFCCLACP